MFTAWDGQNPNSKSSSKPAFYYYKSYWCPNKPSEASLNSSGGSGRVGVVYHFAQYLLKAIYFEPFGLQVKF